LLRSAGLWRALLHRSRADWPVVLAAGLLLLCATALLAAGAVYGDVVALGGLRRAISEAPPANRVVVVGTTAARSDVPHIDEVVSREATSVLGSGGGEVALVIRSGGYVRAGFQPDDPGALTRLGSYRGFDRHATLVAGTGPRAGATPIQAAVSEGAAEGLGATIGDTLSITSRDDASQTIEVQIVGTWLADPGDPYWISDPLELDGVATRGPFTTTGPIVVPQPDLVDRIRARELDLEWRAIPSVDGLRVDNLSVLRSDIATLDDRIRGDRLPGRSLRVSSSLPDILATVDRATLVSRSGVLLLTVQFAILAAYAIILVAGMLIERRRVEGALLRSRGASTLHLTAMAFGEALMLAIPAAILAPIVAVGVVHLLGAVGPLAESGIASTATIDGGVVLLAGLAAAACVIVLTLPSLASGGNPAGVRARIGRQVGRTLAQRLGIDLVLVVVAAIGLWQLRLYGSPLTQNARGALGLDPLLIAAPGLGLLAGGIVATRVVPRIAEVAERILARRRGLVAPIGARQLARRPLRYTRSALLLMLAAALGTFAVSDAATWEASQQDQAAYRAAADVRLVTSDYSGLPSWAVGPALRSIDGVEAASPVVRGPVDVGRAIREGQLVAFDPNAVGPLLRYPNAAAAATTPPLLERLSASRPETHVLRIEGTPARLGIVIDADLHADPDPDANPDGASVPPDWDGITGAAILEDGDGRLHRVEGGRAVFVGKSQRLEIPLTATIGDEAVGFKPPVSVQAVELGFIPPTDTTAYAVGTVDIVGLETSASGTGDEWASTDWAPNADGWLWSSIAGGDDRSFTPPPGSPRRILFGVEDGATEPLFPGGSSRAIRSSTVPSNPETIPAVVSELFLTLGGVQVGDRVASSVAGQRLTLDVIGSVADFPSLDPAKPFAIVDATTLERARQATTGQLLATREWWVGVDEARTAAVEKALRESPVNPAEVIGRESLARSLASDPVSLGLIGALGLGALAALAFASIGFIVSATVTTSERITEFAILRALGLSARELSAWISLENAFLLLFGLVAGSALGLLLAWLVLPFATLTESGAAAVPTPEIVVPWLAIAPLYGAALVLFAITVVIITRQVRRAGISTVLRSGEE
jgi:hypothetical protein